MLLALALGCGPADTDVEEKTGPQLVTGRDLVDFGTVYANTTSIQWLKLENVGDEDLEITGTEFLGGSSYFHVDDIAGTVIEPGDNKGLKLTFVAPDEKLPLHTVVTVDSNDPDGELWVDVMGTPLANAIRMDPPFLEFGQSAVSCSSTLPGTVTNTGETPVTIASLVVEGDAFAVDFDEELNGALPWTLQPTETRTLDVTFTPSALDIFEGSVALVDANGATVVQQYFTGSGADHAHYSDTFTVDGGAVDILIPVQLPEGTAPLATDPEPLLEYFPEFLDTLDQRGVEYQIAILVPDDGCPNGDDPFLDWTMKRDDQMEIVENMLDVAPSVGITHGLNLVNYAVSATNIGSGGCNETLIRDEAKLAIFGYTYVGYNHPRSGWLATVNNEAKVKKHGVEDVTYYGILEDLRAEMGPACGYGSHSLWSDAIDYTGGIWYPICEDNHDAFIAIAEAMGEAQDTFTLSHPADPATITITVGGSAYADFTYDADSNSVTLASSSYGREIVISYDATASCE